VQARDWVEITVHTITGPLALTVLESMPEEEVKEFIREARDQAHGVKTLLTMSPDHENGRWRAGEQLQSVASARILARVGNEDLTPLGKENMSRDEVLTLVREALVVDLRSQLWVHNAPDREEGRWCDWERVIIEHPVQLRADYDGHTVWVEVPERASDEEVRAWVTVELGAEPEQETRLVKAIDHGAIWRDWERVELRWELTHE
jgi:hypothetical protein